MNDILSYIALFAIIILVGQLFNKSKIPISIALVIIGMILSFIPHIPKPHLNPEIVLNIFLPLLLYQISSFSSWINFRKNIRPIALLSIGHVVFITIIVAIMIHTLIPQLGWALSFVLGAVISPPDDVAIVSMTEKLRIPERIFTILEGEGLLNDATALILFRFALAAVLVHQFFLSEALFQFSLTLTAEIIYGCLLGYTIGLIRTKIKSTGLHMIASLLTPFLAYAPAVMLGGSGVIATVATGLIIGNYYAIQFTPEFRLVSRAIWSTIGLIINSILFLVVGLNFRAILENIAPISASSLTLYATVTILTVIIGRFIWVFGAVYFLPRFLFPSIRKKDPYPPWQYPFIVSWAGMRGGISLAAALAVPMLPNTVEGANPRALLIFLVFSVIAATFLLQGLSLPWIMKKIGIHKRGEEEALDEHSLELATRLAMTKAVLRWLKKMKAESKEAELMDEIKLYIREYQLRKSQLKGKIYQHHELFEHDMKEEEKQENYLLAQINDIERKVLVDLWRKEKISFTLRNKLIGRLDHQLKLIAD